MPLALLIFRSSAALLGVSPSVRRTKPLKNRSHAARSRPGARAVGGGGTVTAVGEEPGHEAGGARTEAVGARAASL